MQLTLKLKIKKKKQFFIHLIVEGTLLVLLAVFLTFYFSYPQDATIAKKRLKKVLSGLTAINKKYVMNPARIAIGYGACEDIVFNATDVLHYEKFLNNNSISEKGEVISFHRQLLSTFASYFKLGAAAERSTSNLTLFSELLNTVTNLQTSQIMIGGNAAIMAKRLALDGFDVLLASTITPDLQKLLPKSIKVVGKVTKTNDIHLIFEYKTNERWGLLTAPRANRFILHHDYHNPQIDSLETFSDSLKTFQPHLLIISGLQVMDHYQFNPGYRENRLQLIKKQMQSQPLSTKIHFEMASITEDHFLSLLFDHIIPYTDSLGMNEQELANFYSFLYNKSVTYAADSNPRVGKTLDMMRGIYKIMHNSESKNATEKRRSVTRLHIHTLAYQLIMVANNSGWKNTDIAAVRAALIANTYICGTSEVDINNAMLVIDGSFSVSLTPGSKRKYINDNEGIVCWDEDFLHICLVPNLVCTKAKQTAGCGDNISAVGLGAQL